MTTRRIIALALAMLLFGTVGSYAQDGLTSAENPSGEGLEILDELLAAGVIDAETYQKIYPTIADRLGTALRPAGELVIGYTPWNDAPYDDVISFPGAPEKERGFNIVKAALGFQGRLFYDWVSIKLIASAERQNDGEMMFGLETAYLRFNWLPDSLDGAVVEPRHGFTIGAMKVPFSRQYLTSETNLQFVRRAMVIEQIDIRRDIGATFDANYNIADEKVVLDLRAGVFNGQANRVYTTDNNDNRMYTLRGRVDFFSPIANGEGDTRPTFMSRNDIDRMLSLKGPQLSVGGSFFQNNDIDQIVNGWGLDAEFRWFGLSVLGELVRTMYDPDYDEITVADTLAEEWETDGWYIQGGFFFWPQHMELAFRYEEYELDLLNDVSENRLIANTTFGLNFHIATRHRLKLMADYTQRAELEGMPEIDNDSVTLTAGFKF